MFSSARSIPSIVTISVHTYIRTFCVVWLLTRGRNGTFPYRRSLNIHVSNYIDIDDQQDRTLIIISNILTPYVEHASPKTQVN